ncbi:MAG: recombinase family protein [Muribaculaceae bacterium]|nr:recombinase family protein [Muribaculaceae bacterium]
MPYAMYLRKSRADVEAEARGEGETLAKHEKALTELAKKLSFSVVKQYREIVSGENIAARPQMQALLADVNDGKYDGVLVMEIERLARGDTIDQGVVAQAFKTSGTKIITPIKTYDPNNEFDEEYFEFSLFMSRREYKTIRRRMNAGRIATVKDGNYITPTPPFGYKKIHPEPKVYTLEIIPEQAEIVKMIYDMRLEGKGARAIAEELNRMGISPMKSQYWERVSVKKILENPVYAGKIHWYSKQDGNILCDGRHEAIIPEDTFYRVQELIRSNPLAHVKNGDTLKNYYHGLLYCKNCGHQMIRRYINSSGKSHMLCRYRTCRGKVVGSTMDSVDEALINAMKLKLRKIKEVEHSSKNAVKPLVRDKRPVIEAELTRLKGQQTKIYDFFEQGIYSTEVFLERSAAISEKIKSCETQLKEINGNELAPKLTDDELMVRLETVIREFEGASSEKKNEMLKTVFKKIEYSKTERQCYRKTNSDLKLDVEFL